MLPASSHPHSTIVTRPRINEFLAAIRLANFPPAILQTNFSDFQAATLPRKLIRQLTMPVELPTTTCIAADIDTAGGRTP